MIDLENAVKNLSFAIQIPTVSEEDGKNAEAFGAFAQFLNASYPRMHAALELTNVSGCLVYRWKGTNAHAAPALFLAHMDVVPAPEEGWIHPPFSGAVEDGYVWGRGAIDMKAHLIALCESCESLLADGFTPEADVYFGFGCDEELMKESSAADMARYFARQGIRFSFIFDEGLVFNGAPFGLNEYIAAIGVSEKGYADIRISAKGSSGHASTPPPRTALNEIARALCALEDHPMPRMLEGPSLALLEALAPHVAGPDGELLKGLPHTADAVIKRLEAFPALDALLHTTFAATMAQGSQTSNVLPAEASAIVNVRIAPGDSVQSVVEHIKSVIDPTLTVEVVLGNDPIPPTPLDSPAYRRAAACAAKNYPSTIVAPYPMVAATDSRYFTNLTDCILRFVPFRSARADISGMHGVNERVEIASFDEGMRFFSDLMQTL